ncbi:MAG: SPOR domain-containing protein [Tannerellaceae bacterium]|jgi:hypothetical protein|nr:SPOR domain-containing protein [Tannerellaceae bacterium]
MFITRVTFVALLATLPPTLSPQDNVEIDTLSIFDSLAQPQIGYGTVILHQAEAIRRLVGNPPILEDDDGNTDYAFTVAGYRIQVFTDNDRRTARSEAFEKESQIKEIFPNLPAYVTYPAPFWRLRVGDFRTIEEARLSLHQLSSAFPQYAKDMCIVREDIRISLY